jgi:AcrR family transcriptional regulator
MTLIGGVVDTAVGSKRKTGVRTAGRPPKTSREEIIARAIDILEREPAAGISINRIARELKIAPMAIYNYFVNRDELLQAVTEQMMKGLVIDADQSLPWQNKVSNWANAMHTHFRRYPHLIYLLTWEGHASTAWLRQAGIIIEALTRAGLRGRELARATLWVWSSIMGAIHAELTERESPRTLGEDDLARMDEHLRENVREILQYAKDETHYDDLFQYNLERVIAALTDLVAQH